jgi:hypothetical protein
MLRDAGFVLIRRRQDLTPGAMGVFPPPPTPPYFVIAAGI